MAINKTDCTRIEVEEGTLGGKTYYVWHPDWDNEERAICFRPVKDIPGYGRGGMLCSRPAGHGTDHFGQGACKTHGGMNHARITSVVNGTRATMTQKHLSHRIDTFLEEDSANLTNLTYELAAVRILFRDIVSLFPEEVDDPQYGMYITRASQLVSTIGTLVDKISRIETRNTITANQVLYLRATIADILTRHITDPRDRELALQDLVARMPGGNDNLLTDGT